MKFYITQDGVKRYFKTVEAARKAATTLANDLGRKVTVGYENIAARGKLGAIDGAGVYSRNPAEKNNNGRTKAEFVGAIAKAIRSDGLKFDAAARNHAEFLWRQGTASVVGATRLVKSYIQEDFYKDSPYRANPARPAKHKREGNGYYVEWRNNGRVQRLRYANKGIATINANERKRSGYAAVRVYKA